MKPRLTLTAMVALGFAATLLAQPSPNTNANDHSTNATVTALFSPDGGRVVTTFRDSTVRVWDVQTGKPLSGPPNHWGTWQLVSFKYGEDGTKIEELWQRLK